MLALILVVSVTTPVQCANGQCNVPQRASYAQIQYAPQIRYQPVVVGPYRHIQYIPNVVTPQQYQNMNQGYYQGYTPYQAPISNRPVTYRRYYINR